MQSLGRRYVRRFNDRHRRSGTLWEGRYKATIIESERYLIACMAYIELNPVRAGMVGLPGDYPWSSYAHQTGVRHDLLITPHALYWVTRRFSREAASLGWSTSDALDRRFHECDPQRLGAGGRTLFATWSNGQAAEWCGAGLVG